MIHQLHRSQSVTEAPEPGGRSDGHDHRGLSTRGILGGHRLHSPRTLIAVGDRYDLGPEESLKEGVASRHLRFWAIQDQRALQPQSGRGGGCNPTVIRLWATGGQEPRDPLEPRGGKLEFELKPVSASIFT